MIANQSLGEPGFSFTNKKSGSNDSSTDSSFIQNSPPKAPPQDRRLAIDIELLFQLRLERQLEEDEKG